MSHQRRHCLPHQPLHALEHAALDVHLHRASDVCEWADVLSCISTQWYLLVRLVQYMNRVINFIVRDHGALLI